MSNTVAQRNRSVSKSWKRHRWLVRIVAILAIFGPGLIAANAGNDAGGVLTYASAGAQFGYRTLFVMLLITVALVVVQEMCSRLGAYTGEGLGALIREQFSIRSTTLAMLLLSSRMPGSRSASSPALERQCKSSVSPSTSPSR